MTAEEVGLFGASTALQEPESLLIWPGQAFLAGAPETTQPLGVLMVSWEIERTIPYLLVDNRYKEGSDLSLTKSSQAFRDSAATCELPTTFRNPRAGCALEFP